MAQWRYGYCGLTHETKVQDIEAALRHAIASFDAAAEVERETKAKAVHHLAERLLRARLKAVRARLAAFREPGQKRVTQIQQLETREQELLTQGGAGILKEFAFAQS